MKLRQQPRRRRPRIRLRLEPLENRLALATILVNTTAQEVDSNGSCSLQEAIFAANFDRSLAIDPNATDLHSFIPTGCTAGDGDDRIVLEPGAVYSMSEIVNDPLNQLGPSATPVIFSILTIDANGATLQRTGDQNLRLFSIADLYTSISVEGNNIAAGTTGDVSLRSAYIKGFQAQGGNGARGGGGGLGAGGGIYVKDSVLFVSESTFEGNSATGGLGSTGAGGGGGGLGGNGGSSGNGLDSGGGGGGGARGDGGDSNTDSPVPGGSSLVSAGGGGGGTVGNGVNSSVADPDTLFKGGPGGFNCGAHGAPRGLEDTTTFSADDGYCPGGGGGGGAPGARLSPLSGTDGGDGNYGGGGGGGGVFDDGGDGGFGGGGGAAGAQGDGGDGGFGGGGGAGESDDGEGNGGGGDGSADNGGGGAAYGGAIFNHNGAVTIINSTFTGNRVAAGAGGALGSSAPANDGRGNGAAIFSFGGSLTVLNSTVSGNQVTTHTTNDSIVKIGGIGTLNSALALHNTIIANNGANECLVNGGSQTGSGNLIGANANCDGVVLTSDPLLQSLRANALGTTPTLAVPINSPAIDAGVDLSRQGIVSDQRGVFRPQGDGYDIGAYEFGPPDMTVSIFALPGHVDAGFDLTYTIQVLTVNDAPQARLLAPIPAQTTFADIEGPAGWSCVYDPFMGVAGSAVCTNPLLVSQSVDQFQLTVHVGANSAVNSTLTAAAIASTTLPDANLGDNSYFTSTTVLAYDYGDAPNSYPTRRDSSGARHVAIGPTLGSLRDVETNADPLLKGISDDLPGLEIGSTDLDDEEGVDLPALIAGLIAFIPVTSSVSAKLDAFVDWNRDGDFADLGEKIANSLPVTAGDNTLPVFVPTGASPGPTYARFRLSTAGGLSFQGTAPDGEVEDYAVTVQSFDFGDAPDSYHTLLTNSGARHIATGPRLGSLRDTESNAAALLKGIGDDQVGLEIGSTEIDDEDGVVLIALAAGETATVVVTASDASQLDAFIDFNRDGDFADAGEQIFGSIGVVAGENVLMFAVPPDALPGSTYVRFRLSTAGGLSFDGLAADGEVEDYAVLVQAFDFGDAPDSYATLLAAGGARHVAAGPMLGGSRDVETDAAAPFNGTGDDVTGIDDEDGVRLPTKLIPRFDARFVVTASAAGKLDAWIDYNRNGSFETSEQIAASLAVMAGENELSIFVPEPAVAGAAYARFRISTAGGLGPGGAATDGEVEDYRVEISVPAAGSAASVDDPENPGRALLIVNGTAAGDTIVVQPAPQRSGQFRVRVNGKTAGPFAVAAIGRIVVFGNAGNDSISVSPLVVLATEILGGFGNDVLTGGSGPDTLRGEAGDDKLDGGLGDDLLLGGIGDDRLLGRGGQDILVGGDGRDSLDGGPGRNVLIGGTGSDNLIGGIASDLLIAGRTTHDSNEIALLAIQQEWTSTRSYADRVANLRGGLGPLLAPAGVKLHKGTTVFDDADIDILLGGNDSDWLLLDLARDVALDRRGFEAVN